MAGWDGEPQDVGAAAGVPLGDAAGEVGDGGAEHRLGADHAPQGCQPAGVVGLGRAGDDEAVDVLAGEADLDPGPGHGGLGHGGGHEVVEGPVEVGQGHVDQHPGHGVDRGGLDLGRLALPGRRAPWPGTP